MALSFGPDAFIEDDRQALYGNNKMLEIWDDFNVIPFGVQEYPAKFQIDPFCWSSKKIGNRSRTQLVFDHPPRCGHPPLVQSRQASLRIVRRLDSHEYDEAQHLLCEVLKPPEMAGPFIHIPPKGSLVVAKVYDALFYTPVSDFGPERIDTVAEADREIAHEGAAYRHLSEMSDKAAHPKSTIIPSFQLKFYGLWHFAAKSQDPAFAGSSRSVRLLLLEYVSGLSVAEMCGFKNNDTLVPLDILRQPISDPDAVTVRDVNNTDSDIEVGQLSHWQRRMFIIDAVVDGLARQVHMGVDLVHAHPIRPDQIIVEGGFGGVMTAQPYDPNVNDQTSPRVVVVNYTRAITGKATAYGSLSWQKLPLPCSPIDRHSSRRSLVSLRGWWPASLDKLSDQDGAAFWPAWFKRIFDTPRYIRRTEADPILDKEDNNIDRVMAEEEKKVPARDRPRRIPPPEPLNLSIELQQQREREELYKLQRQKEESASLAQSSSAVSVAARGDAGTSTSGRHNIEIEDLAPEIRGLEITDVKSVQDQESRQEPTVAVPVNPRQSVSGGLQARDHDNIPGKPARKAEQGNGDTEGKPRSGHGRGARE